MKEQEVGTLIYVPRQDEVGIWNGVMYLYGIDLKHSKASDFLHDDEDIRDAMRRTVGEEEV
jgi:hypothetical protein